MKNKRFQLPFSLVLVFGVLLSSCSGGGIVAVTPPLVSSTFSPKSVPTVLPTFKPTTIQSTTTTVIVSIAESADVTQKSISRNSASKNRSVKYISSSAMGVKFSAASLTTQAFDISSGSPLCTGSGASRTCSLPLIAAPGPYTFTLSIYDAAPVAGVIPGPANLLGLSSLTQTINANVPNTLNFLVGGQITSIANATSYVSLPSTGGPQSVGIALLASDHGGNTIGSGPFANAITASITETGGSSHAYLKINGVNVGLSGPINSSTDVVTINYDGLGVSGYTDTIAFSASGSISSMIRMSPMIVSGVASPGGAGASSNVTITEANAPVSVAYTQVLAGCGGIATVPGAGAGSGASGAASVMDSIQPPGGKSCTLTISDNLGSSIILPVTIPPGTPTCATSAVATQLTPSTVANGTRCSLSASYGVTIKQGGGAGAIIVSEANDTTSLTQTNNCAGLATVSPASFPGAGTPSGTAGGTFYATATTSSPSSCTVVVNDGNGQTSSYFVNIVDPYSYTCSNQPYGTILEPNYKSGGAPCLIGDFPLSAVHADTLSVGSSQSVSISYLEIFTTSALTISTTCVGFSVPSSIPNNGGGSYPLAGAAGGYVTATATAADVNTFCTITASDTSGQSLVDTLHIIP